jgi:hypothetical protein
MNEYDIMNRQNLKSNLQRDGDEIFELLPEGERGGGDTLMAVEVVETDTQFTGIPPLMTPASQS